MKKSQFMIVAGVSGVCCLMVGCFLWFWGVGFGYMESIGNKTVAVDGIAYPYRPISVGLFIGGIILLIILFSAHISHYVVSRTNKSKKRGERWRSQSETMNQSK